MMMTCCDDAVSDGVNARPATMGCPSDGEVVRRRDEEIHLRRLHAGRQRTRLRLEADREERLLVERERAATADLRHARNRAELLLGTASSTSPSSAL